MRVSAPPVARVFLLKHVFFPVSTLWFQFEALDFTMFPFSTQNQQDFSNLQRVYLDAVFFPNLASLDFQQEGHRLEHQNPLGLLGFPL